MAYFGPRYFLGGAPVPVTTPVPLSSLFRESLRAALAANTAITAIVGGNIYPIVATTGTTPALTFKVWRVHRLHSLSGPAGVCVARVRFEPQSYDFEDCTNLDELIRVQFDGFTGVLGPASGPYVIETVNDDERDEDAHIAGPPPDGSNGYLLKTRLEYAFHYRESIPAH